MKHIILGIGLFIAIAASIVGEMVFYTIHSENVVNKKVEKAINRFDENNESVESYKGAVYDKNDNKIILNYTMEDSSISMSKDRMELLYKDAMKESCNKYKKWIKEDFELDCDVELNLNGFSVISD